MNKLNDDSIYHIIDYIETFTDFKSMRILNKFYYNLVTDYWKKYKSDKNNVYFTTTCVNISRCVNCKSNGENYNQIYADFYSLPKPIYVCCNKWRCIHNCMTHLFLNAYENGLIYLNKNNKFLKNSIIPRSNNEKTIARIENRFVLFRDNNVYIKTDWIDKKGDAYDKFVTNEYFNFKIRISSWYKNINIDESELKLIDIKNCEN